MAHRDAVAIVMGELFAEGWTQGSAGRGQDRGPRTGPRLGSTARHQHMARAASGNRAVVIKLVRGGGCQNTRQLGNQLEYITGKADVVFDSQGTFEQRGPLAADDARVAADRWKNSWDNVPSAGHTSHLIVSFPKDTDAGDVQAITERFCEQFFDGQYDYVAATHSDRLHPHAHIVVNRHGLNGDLFTLRAGTEHSYENFKTAIVEIGLTQGVVLEASSRLERGIIHRAATDADYRRGRTMDRPRVGEDLEYAQRQITRHSQTYSALAALARGVSAIDHSGFRGAGLRSYTRLGDLARNLDRAAADLKAGRAIIPDTYGGISVEQQDRFNDALQKLDDALDDVDARMAQATPAQQPALEAQLNEAEAMINKALPESARAARLEEPPTELGIYAMTNAAIAAQYVDANGDAEIRAALSDTGLDADAVIARLKEGAPNAALEEKWLVADIQAIARHQGLDLENREDRERALDEIDRIHDRIGEIAGMEVTPEQRDMIERREEAARSGLDAETAPDGQATADSIAEDRRSRDPLETPASYYERFVVTKRGDTQEFYRSYNDERPAIIDAGTTLSTKTADKATALDMVNLAAHRGWDSMKVTGPQDFRREMWIEGAAKGIKVEGYKPNERDIEEATRRADMERARTITRTDGIKDPRASDDARSSAADQSARSPANEPVNYSKGVRGQIIETGVAPYQNKQDGADSYYVRLRLEDGRTHDVWGAGLAKTLTDNALKPGDTLTLSSTRSEQVTLTTRDQTTGDVVTRDATRRAWDAHDIQRGTLVASAAGIALTAAKSDLVRMPAPTDAERARIYKQAVEERLTPEEIARLKEGDISGLDGAGTRQDQLEIAREYLKADGQSPEALKQVSAEYFAERSASREHDKGIDHG
ncbi:MAG: LPD7 domain-containing protein [Roseinatronobacter sp.]